MQYSVNNRAIHYESAGEKGQGKAVVLLTQAIDLTAKTSWNKQGYTVEKLFSEEVYASFHKAAHNLLINCWQASGLPITRDFNLDQYHNVASTTEKHLTAVEHTKLISTTLFPIDIVRLEDRISAICNESLVAKNPFDSQSVFHFRVIRPNQPDNNPLHRDVWLEDYKDCINLYIPLAGSDENSSLVILPESHHWPESKIERTLSGAEIHGVKFNVPAVTGIEGEINFIRPNPKQNEVLIFSPYLIHGGSANLNPDVTRISIEIRLWKK